MVHNPSGQRRATQPSSNLADQLERITPRFDALTQRARLGGTPNDLHEMEAEAQSIAADMVAAFRGRRDNPTHRPRYVSADGTKAMW